MLLVTVPVVVFVGLCTRVGAPARDRRLAMFRMAGATPAETARIAAYETGLAALAGSVVGAVVFFVGRSFADSGSPATRVVYTTDGDLTTGRDVQVVERRLPTDVHLPIPAVLVVIVVIAIAATLASVIALRKVRLSPFGVMHRELSTPPKRIAATMFFVSTTGLILLGAATPTSDEQLVAVVLGAFVLFVICVVGLLLGGASIASAVGRLLAPRVGRPDLLIASRRMVAAPYTSSRATSSVILAVLIGAAVLATRANFLASQDPADTFYADTFDLINIVLVVALVLSCANLVISSSEAIVERRRTLAALAASGTPRSVIARSVVFEALIPLVPSVVLASTAGVLAARSFFGTTVERLAVFEVNGGDDYIRVDVPVPWTGLAVLCGGAILASLAFTSLSLLFLRCSTRVTELRAAA